MKRRFLFVLAALFICIGSGSLFLTYERSLRLPSEAIIESGSSAYQIDLALLNERYLPKGDDNANPQRSRLRLTESDKPLGPAHALHDDIRSLGRGRHSHWGGTLIFSASDNSNPKTNGRIYGIAYDASLPRWLAYLFMAVGLAALLLSDQSPKKLASRALATNWHAVAGLLAVSWRSLLVCCLLIAATFAYYTYLPVAERNSRLETTIDRIIVREQFNRTNHQHDRTKLLFLGDSSCLMGIDFHELQNLISTPTKSLCTMAYVGPGGWAKLLLKQVEASGTPERLVFALHPTGFKRDANWDVWLNYLDELENEKESDVGPAIRFALAMQNGLLSDLIFRPMPGLMGVYYGSPEYFAADVRRDGHAIDPGSGLVPMPTGQPQPSGGERSEKENLGEGRQSGSSRSQIVDYEPNRLFFEALKRLGEAIDITGIDRSRIHILITPIPDAGSDEKFKSDRAAALKMIADALGLAPSQVIELPSAMPSIDFASGTHLNRWGRERYTGLLAEKLRHIKKSD